MLWTIAGVFGASYALGGMIQAVYVFAEVAPGWSSVSMWSRVAANVVGVVALLAALVGWRQHRRTGWGELASGAVLAAVTASAARVVAQVAFGVYAGFGPPNTVAEAVSGLVAGLVASGVGTGAMLARRSLRRQAQAAERDAVERALAVRALEDEEIRVRHAVAEGLHSSMQQRLVLLVAQLDDVLARTGSGTVTAQDTASLRAVRAGLEEVRERDVREMSRMLYPDHLDVGLVPAVRAMLRRVPASIATRLDADPALRAADGPAEHALGAAGRLLAARVVEEGIANALRHARPTSLAVRLGLDGNVLTVGVEDDGGGFDEVAVDRSGTRRLSERLAVVGGELTLDGSTSAGTRLLARIPVGEVSRV